MSKFWWTVAVIWTGLFIRIPEGSLLPPLPKYRAPSRCRKPSFPLFLSPQRVNQPILRPGYLECSTVVIGSLSGHRLWVPIRPASLRPPLSAGLSPCFARTIGDGLCPGFSKHPQPNLHITRNPRTSDPTAHPADQNRLQPNDSMLPWDVSPLFFQDGPKPPSRTIPGLQFAIFSKYPGFPPPFSPPRACPAFRYYPILHILSTLCVGYLCISVR